MEQSIDHMKYMPGMEVIESNIMDQVISKMKLMIMKNIQAMM